MTQEHVQMAKSLISGLRNQDPKIDNETVKATVDFLELLVKSYEVDLTGCYD